MVSSFSLLHSRPVNEGLAGCSYLCFLKGGSRGQIYCLVLVDHPPRYEKIDIAIDIDDLFDLALRQLDYSDLLTATFTDLTASSTLPPLTLSRSDGAVIDDIEDEDIINLS